MSGDIAIWIAAFVTLGIYSFLWRENYCYRLVEHIYIGISVAHLGVMGYFNIKEMAFRPLSEGSWKMFVPITLGCLLYARWFKPIAHLSRLSVAFVMGVTSGVVITGAVKASFLDQLAATMKPVTNLSELVFVICTFSALSYFLFTKKASAVTKPVAEVGRWTLMVAFGSAFGYTVMSRISLFTGRLQFLFGEWINLIK